MPTPHDPQTRQFCPNCSSPLPDEAAFCSHCGQKNTDGRVTFGELAREFFETVFNIDSKIFRTLGALFIPGKLTIEYFKGRHRSYIHPIRIFLVLTVAFIALVAFNSEDAELNLGEVTERTEKDWLTLVLLSKADSVRNELPSSLLTPSAERALDTFELRLQKTFGNIQDSINLGFLFSVLDEDNNATTRVAIRDIYEMPTDSLLKAYQINGFWDQLSVKQLIRLMQQGDSFLPFILGKASWMILLMMPFLALLLKLLYIRRGYYYVEHLIFSFHTHSLVFLIGSLAILFGPYLGEWIIPVVLIGLIVYLWIAMKRVYGQGWFKTTTKFLLLSFFYLVLFVFFFIITLIVSFFLF